MSFGSPSTQFKITVSPPERGSFPLDHDGECKSFMSDYLKCVKGKKGKPEECKPLSKAYLKCRMDRGLMAKDDFENLGFNSTPSTLDFEEKKGIVQERNEIN